MKKLTFSLLIAAVVELTFSGCSTVPYDRQCLPIGGFRPPRGKDEAAILAKMEEPWRESKGSHRMVVRAFSNDEGALAEFFQNSHQSGGSVAGGVMKSEFTLSLLYYWGDHRFAAVLSRQPAKVRRGIGSRFGIGPGNAAAFSKAFPETAKAAYLSKLWTREL